MRPASIASEEICSSETVVMGRGEVSDCARSARGETARRDEETPSENRPASPAKPDFRRQHAEARPARRDATVAHAANADPVRSIYIHAFGARLEVGAACRRRRRAASGGAPRGGERKPQTMRKYAEPDTPLDDVVAGRATNRDAANASMITGTSRARGAPLAAAAAYGRGDVPDEVDASAERVARVFFIPAS